MQAEAEQEYQSQSRVRGHGMGSEQAKQDGKRLCGVLNRS
jgi:hypothetical protein